MKQCRAERGFQLRYSLGDRLLSQSQLVRRLAEVLMVGDDDECADRTEVQFQTISPHNSWLWAGRAGCWTEDCPV